MPLMSTKLESWGAIQFRVQRLKDFTHSVVVQRAIDTVRPPDLLASADKGAHLAASAKRMLHGLEPEIIAAASLVV